MPHQLSLLLVSHHLWISIVFVEFPLQRKPYIYISFFLHLQLPQAIITPFVTKNYINRVYYYTTYATYDLSSKHVSRQIAGCIPYFIYPCILLLTVFEGGQGDLLEFITKITFLIFKCIVCKVIE